ncbi:hypothetical protein MKK67_23025 [Methylobacterium sp. J-072]|uniref:hypothetical protein n=1 Tax=Methylobacterium sp. J-072 TaxID=2836651 RepID=UPI001FBAB994|nr:hypothetical protein [Methylobacterium sp. J-072]MCJ2095350.1 hypothetical protein [Methylobacterium sp. J-072]
MGARVDPARTRVSIRTARAAMLALVTLMVAPATAWAWGVPGCTNLPEYNRALGALQGMTSACDMSVERARQVIAEHDGVPVAQPPVVAPPRVQARRNAGRAHHHRASRHRHAARR